MIHGGTEGQTIELAPGTARLYRLRDGAWTETWTPTWLHGWGGESNLRHVRPSEGGGGRRLGVGG